MIKYEGENVRLAFAILVVSANGKPASSMSNESERTTQIGTSTGILFEDEKTYT